MKYRLKIIDKNAADFKKIEEDGFGGVVFTEDTACTENLEAAKRKKLITLIYIRDISRENCLNLDAGDIKKGELYAVTLKSVKRTMQKFKDRIDVIDGVCIPVPRIKGLLWNDAFPSLYEDYCGEDIKDEFPVIFDKYAENADCRLWLYKSGAEVLFLEYILPISEYFAALGKKACFDFGHLDKGIELIKRQLNPFWFQKRKIPVIYEAEGSITLVCGRKIKMPNLLVLPMRAEMLNYAYGEKYSRQEAAFVLAISEEEYYKNSFKKCDIKYDVADEFTFSKMKKDELKEFENIIICDSCAFSKDDENKIKALKRDGYKINEKSFLDMLDRVN